MRPSDALLAAVFLASPSAINAQSSSMASSAAPVKTSKADPNRMICKTLATTGSRLKANRDCRTAKQWADDQALERRDLDRIQMNRIKND